MNNEFLRHTLSTIAYRFDRAIGSAGPGFGDFSAGSGSRSPGEIVNHMTRVIGATRTFLETGQMAGTDPAPLPFAEEADRFHETLRRLDGLIESMTLGSEGSKRILQGPLSDTLSHIGQLAMLSRLHGNPVPGEDYSAAPIPTGLGG